MSDEAVTRTLAEAGAEAAEPQEDVSRAELLRRRREQRRNRTRPGTLTLPVPPGEVHIAYRRLDDKMRRKAAEAAGGNGEVLTVELLIRACHEVHLLDPRTGRIEPAAIDTDRPDMPVRIDGRLADLLGLDGRTPYEIALQVFDDGDGANTDAIVYHLNELGAWGRGENLSTLSSAQVDDALGEAGAATGG